MNTSNWYTTTSNWYTAPTIPTARIVIKTKNGWHPIQVYKDKDNKSWVEARDGTEFGMEVKNNDSKKILIVSSVDGLNIITGKPAELKSENGYVLNGNSKIIIEGWRISTDAVKSFTFTNNKKNSYASKLGADVSNIGCIGLAYFCEATYNFSGTTSCQDILYRSAYTYDSSPISLTSAYVNTSAKSGAEESFSMGTKMGKEVESEATYVSNTFLDSAFYRQTFYYDSKENLIKNGIIVEKKLPEPFLNDGFCKIV